MFDDNQNSQQQQVSQGGPDNSVSGFGMPGPATASADPQAGNGGDNNPQANGLVQDVAAPSSAPTVVTSNTAPLSIGSADDLLSIKQNALQHLSPLVSHLEQTPEEKFKTTMMMIQASDDQSLIKTAFEAAQAIQDDKARAQALLDIINEINYFTQQHHNS